MALAAAWAYGCLCGPGVTSYDASIQLQQLGAAFRTMPLHQQHNHAQLLGIDDQTALAMRSGDFDRFAEDHGPGTLG